MSTLMFNCYGRYGTKKKELCLDIDERVLLSNDGSSLPGTELPDYITQDCQLKCRDKCFFDLFIAAMITQGIGPHWSW